MLVVLQIAAGKLATVDEIADDRGCILFCGRHSCQFYRGQLGLLEGYDDMYCLLAGHSISSICHPYYLEVVKQQSAGTIEEAEAFELRVAMSRNQDRRV